MRYKETSAAWIRKVAQWEAWKLNSKERERQQAERQKKRKSNKDEGDDLRDDPSSASTYTWEQSFDPNQPLPDFSFIDYKCGYTIAELEQEIKKLSWGDQVQEWALALLRRGIAVHHAGMNKGYRSLVEA